MTFKGKFEDALSRLEEIARLLERGDQPLDESLKIYEEGKELIKFCNKKLNTMEKKIQKLSKSEDSGFQLENM